METAGIPTLVGMRRKRQYQQILNADSRDRYSSNLSPDLRLIPIVIHNSPLPFQFTPFSPLGAKKLPHPLKNPLFMRKNSPPDIVIHTPNFENIHIEFPTALVYHGISSKKTQGK